MIFPFSSCIFFMEHLKIILRYFAYYMQGEALLQL